MNDTYKQLQPILGDKLKADESLAMWTTFKVGGPADAYFVAMTTDELVKAVLAARTLHIPVTVLGGGTNILIGDKGIRGLVIRNMTGVITLRGAKGVIQGGNRVGSVYVEADTGVQINKLVRFTAEEGLGGLEMQLGLPGTVGGAIYMNSKWTHPEGYVGDAVYQARILTPSGEIKDVPKSYFQFAYDTSSIQKTGDIVLSVTFALTPGNKEELWARANESIAYRRETQPQGVKSPGCTFRNIPKSEAMRVPTPNFTTSAGFLVDHAGMKGKIAGGAQISDVHANFIVNTGKATAADVVQLIEMARAAVKKQFGVELEEEIVRLGEF